jgi:hypothetical protein
VQAPQVRSDHGLRSGFAAWRGVAPERDLVSGFAIDAWRDLWRQADHGGAAGSEVGSRLDLLRRTLRVSSGDLCDHAARRKPDEDVVARMEDQRVSHLDAEPTSNDRRRGERAALLYAHTISRRPGLHTRPMSARDRVQILSPVRWRRPRRVPLIAPSNSVATRYPGLVVGEACVSDPVRLRHDRRASLAGAHGASTPPTAPCARDCGARCCRGARAPLRGCHAEWQDVADARWNRCDRAR